MAITYRTVLAEAVRGYNNIQNALAINSSVTGVDLSAVSKSSNKVSNNATAAKMVTEIGKLTTLAALGDITKSTADVDVYTTDGVNSGKNISSIVGIKATTEPTSGYYLAFTGKGSTGKAQISTAGFAPTTLSADIGVESKTKYFPITAASGTLSHSVSEHTTTSTDNAFTPDISKYTGDGANAGVNIQASTGTVTTTEPSSGYYVAVRSDAQKAKKIVADASISTAGYIPTNYDFTADTKYVGLNASSITYIPIEAADITKNDGTASLTVSENSTSISGATNIYSYIGAPTTTKPSSGIIYAFNVSSTGTGTVSTTSNGAGYVESDKILGNVTVSKSSTTYYSKLTEASHNVSVTNTISNPSVTVSGSAVGFTASSDETAYYVTVNGNGTNGSVTSNALCTSTTGFIIGGEDTASDKDDIIPSISGSGSNIYIPAGSVTSDASLSTLTSAGSNATTVTARYFSVTPSINVTEGYIKNGSASTLKNYTVRSASSWSLSVNSISGSSAVTLGSLKDGHYPVIANNLSVTATGSAGTSGWSSSTGSITDSDTDGQTVGIIGAGTISTGSTALTGWETLTAEDNVVVPANGYLYISEGYYPNTQISLATLIPDDTSKANAGTAQILKDYEAYDTNGNKLIGTIATLTPDTAYYQETNNNGYGALGAGYLSKTYYIKAASGHSSSGSVTTKPSVAVSATTSMTTSTSETAYYFETSATPTNGTVQTNYTISTAGWTPIKTGASGNSVTVTPSVSGTGKKYIPAATITANAPTVTPTHGAITPSVGGTVTSKISTITTTKPSGTDGTDYVTIDPGASITTQPKATPAYTYSATAGYTPNVSSTTKTGSATDISPNINDGTNYYLPKQTPAFDGGTFTAPTPSITLSPGEDTGNTNITSFITDNGTTEPTSGYYVAIKADAAKTTATRSAVLYNGKVNGWVNVADNTIAVSQATVTTSNAASTTEYFSLPTATPVFVGGAVSGTISVTTTGTGISLGTATTTKPSGSYITVTKSGSVSRGEILYNDDVYGWFEKDFDDVAISATSSTALSGSGTTYYPVPTVKPSFDGGGLSGGNLTQSGNSGGGLTTSDDGLGELNITTNNSGIYYTATREAFSNTVTRAAVARAAVLYNGDVSGLVNVSDNSIALSANSSALGSTSSIVSFGSSSVTRYIDDITVPKSKTLNSVTLTSGTSTSGTYLTTMTLNSYTTLGTLSSNAGTITNYSGTGTITNYTNTGTITNMTGSRTIAKLATSSASGTLNITTNGYSSTYKGTISVTTNTNGIVNVWAGGAADKGVSVTGHVVTVDGGTAVTDSSGDLITTSRSASTGYVSLTAGDGSVSATGSTNVILGTKTTTKPSSGDYITVTGYGTVSGTGYGSVSTGTGWITEGTTASSKSSSTSKSSNTATAYYPITISGSDSGGVTVYTNEAKTTTTDQLQIYVDSSTGNLIFKTT